MMAPNLSEDEIDDLIYFSRAGEVADLSETLAVLASREGVSPAEILLIARDSGKSTCLHMATGNGNLGNPILSKPLSLYPRSPAPTFQLSRLTRYRNHHPAPISLYHDPGAQDGICRRAE